MDFSNPYAVFIIARDIDLRIECVRVNNYVHTGKSCLFEKHLVYCLQWKDPMIPNQVALT